MSQLDLFANNPFANDQDNYTAKAEAFPEDSHNIGEPSSLTAYKVRESKRAKHVSIKISVEGEVEVVVPPRFARSKLPEILAKRQDWIEKTRLRLLSDRAQTSDDWQVEKPDTVLFRWRSHDIDDLGSSSKSPSAKSSSKDQASAKGFMPEPDQRKMGEVEQWSIAYEPMPGDKTMCLPDGPHRIVVKGNTDHLPACQAVLRKWLAYQAKQDLAPWLRQIGTSIGLPCRKISVRGQKTCWASCSNKKDISLNFKLLFLPRPLVHYVLVHELCHTVHMNHSKDFWALVGEKQPDYEWRRKAMKNAWRYVPRWVETK